MSPAPESDSPLRDDIPNPAAVVLIIGGFIYFVVCIPAIEQRGYPPIDPAWIAIPFLWFAPILISAALDSRPFKSRWRMVAIYALSTAFVDAGTPVPMVPKRVHLLGMVLETVLFFGPYHLVVAFVLEILVAGFKMLLRRFFSPPPAVQSAVRWTVAGVLVAATFAAPFVWREMFYELTRRSARKQADEDWAARKAMTFGDRFNETRLDGAFVNTSYDPATGLRWGDGFHRFFGYDRAYNRRIEELLQVHGVPDWSMKPHLVRDKELVAMLESDDMEEITELPFDVSDGITLFLTGTITRWGSGMSSGNDGLSVATKNSGLIGVGTEKKPIYLQRSSTDPKVVFIRNDHDWIGAFHVDGWLLSYASR